MLTFEAIMFELMQFRFCFWGCFKDSSKNYRVKAVRD